MLSLFFISVSIILFLYIIRAIKKNYFSENESIFWFIGGIAALILSIFPNIINRISSIIGIYYPPSLLFLLGIFFLLIINFFQDKKISHLNEKTKELAQNVSILEEKIRNLNKVVNDENSSNNSSI